MLTRNYGFRFGDRWTHVPQWHKQYWTTISSLLWVSVALLVCSAQQKVEQSQKWAYFSQTTLTGPDRSKWDHGCLSCGQECSSLWQGIVVPYKHDLVTKTKCTLGWTFMQRLSFLSQSWHTPTYCCQMRVLSSHFSGVLYLNLQAFPSLVYGNSLVPALPPGSFPSPKPQQASCLHVFAPWELNASSHFSSAGHLLIIVIKVTASECTYGNCMQCIEKPVDWWLVTVNIFRVLFRSVQETFLFDMCRWSFSCSPAGNSLHQLFSLSPEFSGGRGLHVEPSSHTPSLLPGAKNQRIITHTIVQKTRLIPLLKLSRPGLDFPSVSPCLLYPSQFLSCFSLFSSTSAIQTQGRWRECMKLIGESVCCVFSLAAVQVLVACRSPGRSLGTGSIELAVPVFFRLILFCCWQQFLQGHVRGRWRRAEHGRFNYCQYFIILKQ